MPKEEWKFIKGYEGMYEVSNLGRVRSVSRVIKIFGKYEIFHEGKIMNSYNHCNGYRIIFLRGKDKRKKFFIHRLVASVFLDRPQGKDVVNHIDCNKVNNVLSNLEWMTFSENTQYYYATERAKNNDF